MIATRALSLASASAALALLAACGPEAAGTAARAAQPVQSAQTAEAAGAPTATGAFVGDSGHVASGGVSVARGADGGWLVILAEDFSFDGAPDPKISFGKNGHRPEAVLAPLRQLSGRQVYAVPAALDYDQVWIWCEEFSVPLGHADLALN